MLVAPNIRHSQVAYVTNDLDGAMALFARNYGVPGFYSFESPVGGMTLRIALAQIGGDEIELIQPLGDAPLYTDIMPPGDALAIRFHHVCIRIEGTLEEWDRHRAGLDTTAHPVVLEGGFGDDLRFIYTDERAGLGHYIEHVWMSPALRAQLAGAIPTYPG